MSKLKLLIRIIGAFIILIGFLINPLLIEKILSFSGNLEKSSVTAILIIESIIVLTGFVIVIFHNSIFKKRKEFLLLSITLLIASSLSFFLLINFYEFAWLNIRGADEIVHHRAIPNTNYRVQIPDYENLTELYLKKGNRITSRKTNSLGFVDDEIDVSDKSKIRILMLGDSFTEGGIFDKNFVDMLEEELNSHTQSNNYEVINTGFGSYSPIIEYNVLKHIGIKFNPKIVILTLDMSDISNDFEYSKEIVQLNDDDYIFLVDRPAFSRYEKLYNSFKLIFSIFKSFGDGLNNFFEKLNDNDTSKKIMEIAELKKKNSGDIRLDPIYAYSFKNETEFKIHLNRTLYYISKINKLSKENNITFILHSYPHSPQISRDYSCYRESTGLDKNKIYSNLIFEELTQFSKADNITLWLSKDILKNSQIPPYFQCDMHLNEYGQKLIAEFLFDKLVKHKLI